jgi:outer membrane immunogenic protein
MIAPDDERARLMRWVICAAFACALAPSALLAPSAFAADLDDALRGPLTVGPATFTRWAGFYAGGQFNYSSVNVDFSKATKPLIADSLRDTTLEAQNDISDNTVLKNNNIAHTNGWGGFVGYNTQWQDLIIGIEGNYTHAPFSVTAVNNPIGRIASASGTTYSVNITGSGSLDVTDFGSARVRMGYVFNNFLPYGFAGVALGRGSYNVTSEVFGQGSTTGTLPCDPIATPTTCTNYDLINGTSKTSALLYGFVVGGGLDVAVTQNVFVRAEYEFMQFAPFANITATISSARLGAGFKF